MPAGESGDKMTNILKLTAVAALMAAGLTGAAYAQDKVTFGTNWLAQAEHGGYYQAVADGTYAKYGLDVTIAQGGPQAPMRTQLVAGQIQFYMGGTTSAINAVKEGIPTITLASIFQKDPQVLMSHPGKFAEFKDLAGASKYILSAEGFTSYFTWMKAQWPEFVDDKYEPYQFNPASFLADENSIQQGYLTSEPLSIETESICGGTAGPRTVIVTSLVDCRAPSLAVRRRTYVPAEEKLAVVDAELTSANVTAAGPLTFDQVVVTAPGETGSPSSDAEPAN